MPNPLSRLTEYHSPLRSRIRRALKPYGIWGLRHLHFHRLNNVQTAWQLGPVHVSVSKRSRMVTGVHFERDRWCQSGWFSLSFGRSGVHAWWARDYHVGRSCVSVTRWREYRSIGQRVEWALPSPMPHVDAALEAKYNAWADGYVDSEYGGYEYYDEDAYYGRC